MIETNLSSLHQNSHSIYDVDYLKWIETTVEKLKTQNYSTVDWENLIEEIEDMGRSERRSLESNLIVILLHLLKWQFQPEKRTGSWERSIIEHRRRVNKAIKESPSLLSYLESIFAESYPEAVKQAKAETGLPRETFLQECPYSLADVMDDDFLPE
ncbi:MAG: DUF29 domain-containing protein [Nostocales cyanobacterium]|nr:MAG: DUF29 domain-containing protein [Nostocales cyanobacterium]